MTEQVRRAARLIEIERLLRRHPGGMTANELADRCACSSRTIQRDLSVLESELSVPLMLEGRRYRIMPGAHPLSPVRFTLHEARAIFLATRLFLRHADERDPDGISALQKLAASLPHAIAAQVELTAQQLRRRPQRRAQNEVLRRITEGWAASRTVSIRYRSVQSGGVPHTDLDPYLLEPSATGAAVYVIGHSRAHGEVRTFKIERIQQAELTAASFEPPDVRQLVEKLSKSWGVVFGEDEYDVAVDFSEAVSARISETNWHPSQTLVPLDGGGVRLQLKLPSLLEFIPWVRGWGPDALVVAPEELKQAVASSLASAAARYSGD
jgi:predicted DNA-binding transcriptional regulator YafY